MRELVALQELSQKELAERLEVFPSSPLALAPAGHHNGRMTREARAIADEALSVLSGEEKLVLIDRLWESLDLDDFPLTPELRAELDRRLARRAERGPSGVPWESFRASLVATQR